VATLRRIIIVAVAVCGLFISSAYFMLVVVLGLHLGRIFNVPNAGMAPAIARGDEIYVDALTFRHKGPVRGDVVVFHGNGLPTLVRNYQWQVKRIVGLPGDTVSIRDGTLCINDHPAPELTRFQYDIFMYDNFLTNEAPSYTVPPDAYFVLGDFSNGSYDSRFFGAVPAKNIVGRALFRCWPLARAGAIK
jgi:signal peptidase I